MTTTIPSTADNSAYKSLLYWRKNLWNGAACVPVVLTLEDEVLSMRAADGTTVFSEARDKITVRFTGWGTMLLVVAGKKYDVVGMPAATSPAISDAQKAELSGLTTEEARLEDKQPVVLGGAVATATGNSGATIVGAAVSTAVYYRGLNSIREWKALIGSSSDQKKKLSNMTYFIAIMVVGLIIAIALK
jgi:hypothetical protein